MSFLFNHHVVNGLYPKADAFASSATTDFVKLENYRKVTFLVHTGDSTGGTSNGVITVLASAKADGSNSTAIPFKYRKCLSSTSVDTWGDLTDASNSGFAMDAADNVLYAVEVAAEDVEAAAAGKPFVGLKVTEDTDDPVVAGCLIVLGEPRYGQKTPVSAIS